MTAGTIFRTHQMDAASGLWPESTLKTGETAGTTGFCFATVRRGKQQVTTLAAISIASTLTRLKGMVTPPPKIGTGQYLGGSAWCASHRAEIYSFPQCTNRNVKLRPRFRTLTNRFAADGLPIDVDGLSLITTPSTTNTERRAGTEG